MHVVSSDSFKELFPYFMCSVSGQVPETKSFFFKGVMLVMC